MTDKARKSLFIIMVGLNKETTKNEQGMRGYLADTLSKTDKYTRESSETKKYFLTEVFHHMEKIKLAEEEKRNVWYFDWSIHLDLRDRLIDLYELLLTNAEFYFVSDYKNFTVPESRTQPVKQFYQNKNQYPQQKPYQQNPNKQNQKQQPQQNAKPLKNAWGDSSDSEKEVETIKEKQQSQEKDIQLKTSDSQDCSQKNQNKPNNKYPNQKFQQKQNQPYNKPQYQQKKTYYQQKSDKYDKYDNNQEPQKQKKEQKNGVNQSSSDSDLLADSEVEQQKYEERIQKEVQKMNKDQLFQEIAHFKKENEKLEAFQDIKKVKDENLVLKRQLEALTKKLNQKTQILSELQTYLINIKKEIVSK